MYDDYAINETLFHWQTQNATRADLGKGLIYIDHEKLGKRILKFVREKAKDEYGNTMGYVFLGEVEYVSLTGSKPYTLRQKGGSILYHFFMASNNRTAVNIANDIVNKYNLLNI